MDLSRGLGDVYKRQRLHMLFLDSNRITEAGATSVADCLKNK
jgi:hypothetical protein